MTSTTIAKEELDSFTQEQRDLHVVDEGGAIMFNFYRVFEKSTWYSSVLMKLKSTDDGDSETVYETNKSFHYLTYSYMRFSTPHLKIRPELEGKCEFAFCHNLGTNISSHAVFKETDIPYHTWDNVWADIFFQFFQKSGAGKRDNHHIGIGNIPELEDWSSEKESCNVNVEQPWFYGLDRCYAYPIYATNSQTKAEHRYTWRRKLSDLIRIRILNADGDWQELAGKIDIDEYLDTEKCTHIKTPELWGRYALLSKPELTHYKRKGTRSFFIRDIEICDTPNENKFGTTADIPLDCNKICLAFFWVAENNNATTLRNYSNYTTNKFDLYQGRDPITATTLKYGNSIYFDKLPSDHFSIAQPREHFPSSPDEIGYHGYSYASDCANYDADIGVVLGNLKAKLLCNINSNNKDNQDCTFNTRVRLLVLRKCTVDLVNDTFSLSIQ